jgi:hypothetical protein
VWIPVYDDRKKIYIELDDEKAGVYPPTPPETR